METITFGIYFTKNVDQTQILNKKKKKHIVLKIFSDEVVCCYNHPKANYFSISACVTLLAFLSYTTSAWQWLQNSIYKRSLHFCPFLVTWIVVKYPQISTTHHNSFFSTKQKMLGYMWCLSLQSWRPSCNQKAWRSTMRDFRGSLLLSFQPCRGDIVHSETRQCSLRTI